MHAVTATVLQLSDIHLPSDAGALVYGLDPDACLARVVDAWIATGQRADLVLVTGDDADTGSPAAYERLARMLAPLDAPLFVIAGNHDLPEALRAEFGSSMIVEVAGWRVVGVDSTVPDEICGAVDATAVAATLDALDNRPTVVAIHHPPVSPSTHPMFQLHGAEELLAVLADRPHVRAVASGHLHLAFEVEVANGMQLLGAPSTWEPIDHDGDVFIAPGTCEIGARLLRLADDGQLTSELLVI